MDNPFECYVTICPAPKGLNNWQTNLEFAIRGWHFLLVGLVQLEGAGAGLSIGVDVDGPLVAVLPYLGEWFRVQERCDQLAVSKTVHELLEVLIGNVLVFADDLRHFSSPVSPRSVRHVAVASSESLVILLVPPLL